MRNGLDLLLADDPDSFGAAMIRAAYDRERRQTLVTNGLLRWQERYSFDAATGIVRDIVADAMAYPA